MQQNKSHDKDLGSLLEEIKQELLIYINKRLRYIKLDSMEKGGILASSLGYSLIVLAILFILLFFILIGAAFFISELLDSHAAGFGIMALLSLIVLTTVILCKNRIKPYILNKAIVFFKKLDKNDTE